MGERKHVWEKMTTEADLNNEPVFKQSLVEVVGERRVLIENHCGVKGYNTNEICVNVRSGKIIICGNSLEIIRMTKEQLVIFGTIDCVRFCKGGR